MLELNVRAARKSACLALQAVWLLRFMRAGCSTKTKYKLLRAVPHEPQVNAQLGLHRRGLCQQTTKVSSGRDVELRISCNRAIMTLWD